MQFIEVLKAIFNTFIRKKVKIEPEGDTEVTKELKVKEVDKKLVKDKEQDDRDLKIRRYRAFAYHHKKKRIRKKYLKMLLKISPVDGFVYAVKRGSIVPQLTWSNGYITGVDYSSQKDFSPGYIGSRKKDHQDSRAMGGIR